MSYYNGRSLRRWWGVRLWVVLRVMLKNLDLKEGSGIKDGKEGMVIRNI